MSSYAVSTVFADGLVPLGAMISAGWHNDVQVQAMSINRVGSWKLNTSMFFSKYKYYATGPYQNTIRMVSKTHNEITFIELLH